MAASPHRTSWSLQRLPLWFVFQVAVLGGRCGDNPTSGAQGPRGLGTDRGMLGPHGGHVECGSNTQVPHVGSPPTWVSEEPF